MVARRADLDDIMDDGGDIVGQVEEGASSAKRREIGRVESFFAKIGVVAIALAGTLKVGDTIEIEDGGRTIRQRVESMQINRENVEEAHDGDSVGIKLGERVGSSGKVFLVEEG